jgi:NAD(P)-dependent dehydrogenase (short-subunit alcohol dehydrogenase family)
MAPQPVTAGADAADALLPVAGRLSGRRVLVTGAASGIGLAIARLFRAAGAAVASLDRDAPPSFDVPQAGALSLRADVTDGASVEAAVAQAARSFGGLDGLVNAAGIANTALASEVTLADWRRVVDVNLTGTFIVCRACEPLLRASPVATIVNLSSGQGLLPSPGRSAYAASKAGVIALTRSLAMEWAPAIRVNTLCPGATDTPMVREGYDSEALAKVGTRYALGRIAQASEIALGALYLTGAESSFVTGIALAIDGGRSYH